ncbi:MAG: hypothetical protein JNM63_17865, partial [Spirochaetia bacterium]|nr:hypothetical protein [Spirochaetia bacterium]
MTPDPDFQKSSPGTWSFNSWLTTAESGGIPGKIICASDQDKGSWDQSLKLKPGDSYVIR